jgi:type I restriction enzyme S subunit
MREELENIGKEWLSNIPENWKIDRIKDSCERVVGGGTPKSSVSEYWDEGEIIWVSPTDFSAQKGNKFISDSAKKITRLGLSKSSATLVPKGAIVMSSRASIGEPKIAAKEISTNQGFVNFVTNHKLHNNFLFYCIEGQLGSYFEEIASGTTYKELSRRMAKKEVLPIPPFTEQKAIADYLDRATKKIDRVIAIKEKQLERIEGYFQQRINEVIRQGIDNNELEPVDWMWTKRIPKKWKKGRFKDFLRLSRGVDLPKDKMVEGDFHVMGSNGSIGTHNEFTTEGPGITVGRSGSVGAINYVPEHYWAHNTCLYVYENNGNNWRYLFYFLQGIDLSSLSGGSVVGTMNRNYIHREYVAMPEKQEQDRIVTQLYVLEKKKNDTKQLIANQITTLQAYRQSLIYECVTGKKRVYEGKTKTVEALEKMN